MAFVRDDLSAQIKAGRLMRMLDVKFLCFLFAFLKLCLIFLFNIVNIIGSC